MPQIGAYLWQNPNKLINTGLKLPVGSPGKVWSSVLIIVYLIVKQPGQLLSVGHITFLLSRQGDRARPARDGVVPTDDRDHLTH